MTNLAGLKRIIISWLYGSAALLVGLPLLIGLYAYWRHPPIPFPLWIACFSLFGTLGYMLYALSLAAKRWRAAVSVLST
ncbi:MAG: hypothetical protein K0Q59_3397, partial [Paenibacillus sp.]|nr:hypothetical protein [Paenibacillus sp.]